MRVCASNGIADKEDEAEYDGRALQVLPVRGGRQDRDQRGEADTERGNDAPRYQSECKQDQTAERSGNCSLR